MDVLFDEEWQTQAACRGVPVRLFFPPVEQEADDAKAVCAQCTVKEPCLEFALAGDERFGVWGGLTPYERRVVAVRRTRTTIS